jgi:paraquat-inducible protein B
MSRRANARLIGAFVLGAIAICFGLIVVFGSGKFFVQTKTYVLFFQDDVAGLNVGAPVTFRGVRVGSVTDILIRYDGSRERVLIPVYITVQPSKLIINEGEGGRPEALIEAGLRAQLRTQSFVTGLLSVNLDFEPSIPPVFVGADERYTELPTVRSAFTEARATITDVLNELRKLPLGEMIQQLSSSARNLDRLVADTDVLVNNVNADLGTTLKDVSAALKEVPPMMRSISQAANDVSKLTRDIDAGVPQLRDGTIQAVTRLNDTLDQVQKAVGGIQATVGDTSPLQSQMARTLGDSSDAAVAVRALTEYLNQNPSALLTGRGKDADNAR